MSINLTKLDEQLSVAGQNNIDDKHKIVDSGYMSLNCNGQASRFALTSQPVKNIRSYCLLCLNQPLPFVTQVNAPQLCIVWSIKMHQLSNGLCLTNGWFDPTKFIES